MEAPLVLHEVNKVCLKYCSIFLKMFIVVHYPGTLMSMVRTAHDTVLRSNPFGLLLMRNDWSILVVASSEDLRWPAVSLAPGLVLPMPFLDGASAEHHGRRAEMDREKKGVA